MTDTRNIRQTFIIALGIYIEIFIFICHINANTNTHIRYTEPSLKIV